MFKFVDLWTLSYQWFLQSSAYLPAAYWHSHRCLLSEQPNDSLGPRSCSQRALTNLYSDCSAFCRWPLKVAKNFSTATDLRGSLNLWHLEHLEPNFRLCYCFRHFSAKLTTMHQHQLIFSPQIASPTKQTQLHYRFCLGLLVQLLRWSSSRNYCSTFASHRSTPKLDWSDLMRAALGVSNYFIGVEGAREEGMTCHYQAGYLLSCG